MRTLPLLIIACLVLTTLHANAAETKLSQADAEKLFVTKIHPMLKSKCFGCHGDDPKKVKAEFDIRTREGMLKGGDSGYPALEPGAPMRSLVYTSVTWDDENLQMPPKENDRLTAEQITEFRRWIEAGAPWPDAEATKRIQESAWNDTHNAEGVIVKTSGGLDDSWTYRRYAPDDLWSFQPVRKVQPAAAKGAHPIDAFINASLAEKGLTPADRADKVTLLRRATFDLTGLPPTPQEIADFLADDSAQAWEKVINRLLDSPRYGERWAQHWLDVVRYADTSGGANDFERPNAWRYRDYVIRSLNADKPYDRFVVEQLAGDELEPKNPEMHIAVGFLRMGPWEHTGMSVAAETRQQFLDDITNAVGVTFLGHAVGCAKCHDHKFDPIPTRDYYSLMSVFAPVQFGEKPTAFLPVENISEAAEERERYERLLADTREKQEFYARKVFEAGLQYAKERGYDISKVKIDKLSARGAYAYPFKDLPENVRPPRNYGLKEEELGVRKVLEKRLDYIERFGLRYEPLAFSVYNGPPREKPYLSNNARNPIPMRAQGEVEKIHVLSGGSLQSPMAEVKPGVLSAAARNELNIPEAATGRRLALARWIASPDNPLTARVMVNRIWQHHFAEQPLVGTPNNFGRMGKRPTHPELLDYLAATFVEQGWSLKQMHRLIMTSAAYQRSGRHDDIKTLREKDANNDLLAVYPTRRLTAEELRDAMLQASGELSLTMGGAGIFPDMNMEAALQPRHIMGSVAVAYQPSPRPEQRNRRTIYAFRFRGLPDPMLEVFNAPNAEMSCEKRDSTTVTPQVFALFNGQSSYDRALAMARRLESMADQQAVQIDHAYRLLFGRAPTAREAELAAAHIQKMTRVHETATPLPQKPPIKVTRTMVEEMTGVPFSWDEPLDIFANGYVSDAKPWDVGPATRALAELCLVLMNANEFAYVY